MPSSYSFVVIVPFAREHAPALGRRGDRLLRPPVTRAPTCRPAPLPGPGPAMSLVLPTLEAGGAFPPVWQRSYSRSLYWRSSMPVFWGEGQLSEGDAS